MSLPERLGRLRRVDRIGAGGFATVWLYHDDELDSPVAVKALADNWAQRQDVCDRFLEEARILRRADSDHVVRVYDIGALDGTPYFVMSYADRGTVADLLEPGVPLPAERVVELLAQAGDGVSVLHRHGVIHRDIKPQNLLLRSTPDGGEKVLVADLGVAKAMLHASGLTQVVGTPSYMAPEQANGIGLDLRADVHALGAVAYQLLTGRLVRDGGFATLAQPVLPPAPSTVADVPASFDSVVLRALAVDPEDRWPDVPSLVAGLRWAERTAVRHEALSGTTDRRFAPLAASTEPGRTPTPLPDQRLPDQRLPDQQLPDQPATESPGAGPEAAQPRDHRGRVLPLAALSLLVLLVSFGAAYGVTRVLDGDGSAAQDPSGQAPSDEPVDEPADEPADEPIDEPTDEPAGDIDYPALDLAGQDYEPHVVRSGATSWQYPVPSGWLPHTVSSGDEGPIPVAKVDGQRQVRWRPADEPPVGGYSLRVEALAGTDPVAAMVAQKVADLEGSADLRAVDVFDRTDDTVYFSYRDDSNRLRYNFFRWVAGAEGLATLEISVTGRRADEKGLKQLLDTVSGNATP